METKSLLYGLVGFFIGGLIVSIGANTFDKPATQDKTQNTNNSMTMSMQMSASNLANKTGDEFDSAFISEMIAHHEGAVEMAKLSANNAKHEEIKKLSAEIISAQEKEIKQMKQWQKDWGYSEKTPVHNNMNMSH